MIVFLITNFAREGVQDILSLSQLGTNKLLLSLLREHFNSILFCNSFQVVFSRLINHSWV